MKICLISIIQGITEFFPVSSSTHIQLINKILCFKLSSIIGIIAHLGTILPILVYFRKSLIKMFFGFWKINSESFHSSLKIICALLPSIIVGFCLHKLPFYKSFSQSLFVAGWSSIIFGIALYLVDRHKLETHQDITYFQAFMIGIGQVLAFIPGASRLGTSLMLARFLKINRLTAATFSFLMSIPLVIGALILESSNFQDHLHNYQLSLEPMVIYTIFFFLTSVIGWITLSFFIKLLNFKNIFFYIMIYRILFGILILQFI